MFLFPKHALQKLSYATFYYGIKNISCKLGYEKKKPPKNMVITKYLLLVIYQFRTDTRKTISDINYSTSFNLDLARFQKLVLDISRHTLHPDFQFSAKAVSVCYLFTF